ncbi:hypothetical protein AB835_00420 [Candidatus Endobugula sertula]|uniref:Uncharacterized protein n=1 Tax=Candidatus Endobugula sertula TaxID=62101 RepID=A0A1D2QTT7_9GAMM|nr:hypothetical protein AB835_00420 [Candidatus Endobugula sertula]
MKRQRAPLEVFNIAFLDIISCAFGAIILLVLLAKHGTEGDFLDLSKISELIQAVAQAEQRVDQQMVSLSDKQKQWQQLQASAMSNTQQKEALESDIAAAKNQLQQLTSTTEGLRHIVKSRQRAALQQGIATERDEEVGGIPVDSEYVIFIVDTSGSMRRIWNKVLKTMSDILDNHPKVKGIQVMSDMGDYLVSSSRGKWRKDTPGSRKAILSAMQQWNGRSNSSPVEGLTVALKTYARKTKSLSIYILGDEYSGGSYDPVINTLNKLNSDSKTGRRFARVHAIGFLSGQPTIKYSTLMREVTQQNRGSFLALP